MEIAFRLMLYIALAEAWNLLAGFGGLVSLGSAAFIGVGAYVFTGALNQLGVPPGLGLLLGGAAGGLLAVAVSPAVFRMRGLYFTVGTLALGEAMRLFMVNVPWFGGSRGLFLDADFPTRQGLYLWALALLVVAELVVTVYTQSRLSIILRAVRDDEDAAAQFGVRVFRVKLLVFVVASILMAMGGGLQAYKLGAVEPYGMFGLPWSIDILAMVVIGGLGLRYGAVVGAVFVIALAELLADWPEIHIVITGVILILVVRFAPRGIAGLAAGLWRSSAQGGGAPAAKAGREEAS
jgi:branched-chain amino acid transport system permease protein